jgi:hypothetical protein
MILRSALAALLILLWGPPASAQSVEVLWSQGPSHLRPVDSPSSEGTVPSAGPAETWPALHVGDVVSAGGQIAVMRDARVDLMRPDGQVWTVSGPVRVTVTKSGLDGWASHRRRELVLADLRPDPGPVAATWQSRRETSPAPVHLVAPRATEVAERAPHLRWQGPSTGRFDLLLERLGDDGTLEVMERWQNLETTEHTLWYPLTPGTFYRWEVQLRGAPGVHAWSWFRVQTQTERQASEQLLARLERRLRSWVRADDPVDETVAMVLRARWYEALGRLDEAHQMWSKVAEVHARAEVLAYVDRLRRRVVRPMGWLDEEDLPSGIQPMVP